MQIFKQCIPKQIALKVLDMTVMVVYSRNHFTMG